MTLPAFDMTPEAAEGPSYKANRVCAVPDCAEATRETHHLVRRSAHGRPANWIHLPDGRVMGNLIGLCVKHHRWITGPIGGYPRAIRWHEEKLWWCNVKSDGRGSVSYEPLAPLTSQPPSPDSLDESATHEEPETGICPECGQKKRAGPRLDGESAGEARPRKTWQIKVPDDHEDGAEVLDTLVDDLAPVLGYESVPNTRYHVVARTLVFAQMSKRELLASMEGEIMTQLNYTETLTVVYCTCGVAFAIPGELERQAHDKGKTIYCPLGHGWHYSETLEKKLQRERLAHQATKELLTDETNRHRATRGNVTKLKKKIERVEAGVCPHCRRNFQNLARHMEAKHSS